MGKPRRTAETARTAKRVLKAQAKSQVAKSKSQRPAPKGRVASRSTTTRGSSTTAVSTVTIPSDTTVNSGTEAGQSQADQTVQPTDRLTVEQIERILNEMSEDDFCSIVSKKLGEAIQQGSQISRVSQPPQQGVNLQSQQPQPMGENRSAQGSNQQPVPPAEPRTSRQTEDQQEPMEIEPQNSGSGRDPISSTQRVSISIACPEQVLSEDV